MVRKVLNEKGEIKEEEREEKEIAGPADKNKRERERPNRATNGIE